MTQREFLAYVREHQDKVAVSYEFPGIFRAGGLEVRIQRAPAHELKKKEPINTFLAKLGEVMTFRAYDTLARNVWVSHSNATRGQGWER